ncbi:MAG: helix-turn-helix domain-containing protein [Candidatus Caldarchaeum sp.]
MKSTEIEALKLLTMSPARVEQIAAKLNLSRSQSYRVLNSLMRKGFVEKVDDTYAIGRNPLGKAIVEVSSRYNISKILEGSTAEILMHLLTPRKSGELLSLTGLSQTTVGRVLNTLMESGIVRRKGWNYQIVEDENLRHLIVLLKQARWGHVVEPEARVLFSNDYIIKTVPRGLKAEGVLTAFSRFKEFNVDYIPNRDYYVYPSTEIDAETVLVHSLIASETRMERSMCAVFFLVNSKTIDMMKARKIARKTPVTVLLSDLENYVSGLPCLNPGLFLPWDEFQELCRLYGLQVTPAPKMDDIIAGIAGWAKMLDRCITAYLLGGINMVIRGLKPATKDIDILVQSKEDYETVEKALLAAGYERAAEWTPGDRRAQPTNIFVHRSMPRIDLFTETVSRVKISESMTERANLGFGLGNLKAMLLHTDDVALLKLLTARERDLSDAAEIIRLHGVSWKTILEEFMKLPKEVLREKVFLMFENMEDLQRIYGIKVPRSVLATVRKTAVDSAIEQQLEKGETNVARIAELAETHPAYVRKRMREKP